MKVLTIIRQEKHPFHTAYGGVTIAPGSSTHEKPEDVEKILADKNFQKDRAAKLFQVIETDVAEEALDLEEKDPKTKNDPHNVKNELATIAAMGAPEAVTYVTASANPYLLFAVNKAPKERKTVKAAAVARLKEIYGRELTEAELEKGAAATAE